MKNMVLLSNKNSCAWDFAEKIQKYFLDEKSESVPLYEVPLCFFRSGEIRFDSTKNLRTKDVYYIQDSSKNPQEWWVELLLLKDMILRSSARSLTFVLPNLLYSRQDRKDKSHVPISARALADSISPGTNRIITMDLHAGQIQGFYPATTPLDNLYSFPEVVRYLVKNYSSFIDNLLIVSPDAGGVARAKSFLIRIERVTGKKCELAFMIKERPKPGEVGEMRYIGPDPSGKNVLILDDILDSGQTLCHTAEELKKKGVNTIMCYATHGLFTEGVDKFKGLFDAVLTSNTHKQKEEFVEVIDVSSLFAEAIYRVQVGESVSELFE